MKKVATLISLVLFLMASSPAFALPSVTPNVLDKAVDSISAQEQSIQDEQNRRLAELWEKIIAAEKEQEVQHVFLVTTEDPEEKTAEPKAKSHPFKAVGHFVFKYSTLPVMVGGGFVIGGFVGHIGAIIAPWSGAAGGALNWHRVWTIQEEYARLKQAEEDAK